jgi:hypothetical protein
MMHRIRAVSIDMCRQKIQYKGKAQIHFELFITGEVVQLCLAAY